MVIPISNSMINIIAVFGAGCADTLYLVVFILFFALLVALSVVTYLIYRKKSGLSSQHNALFGPRVFITGVY